jgi:hypothetical protein
MDHLVLLTRGRRKDTALNLDEEVNLKWQTGNANSCKWRALRLDSSQKKFNAGSRMRIATFGSDRTAIAGGLAALKCWSFTHACMAGNGQASANYCCANTCRTPMYFILVFSMFHISYGKHGCIYTQIYVDIS